MDRRPSPALWLVFNYLSNACLLFISPSNKSEMGEGLAGRPLGYTRGSKRAEVDQDARETKSTRAAKLVYNLGGVLLDLED